MDAEDLLCDYRGDRKAVEDVGKCLPDLEVASSLAFVVETVDAGDIGAFVITP
jgi:hypothetical protein